MLPGFRILFALIVLSFAILVFGFSALALLRTAHENLASQPIWQPAWRSPVEIASAQRNDREQITNGMQTLALLRVDPPALRAASRTENSGSSVAPPPVTDAPPTPSPVQEQHGDATPSDAATEAKSQLSAEAPAATANTDDRPTSQIPPGPVTGARDRTSEQATRPVGAEEGPKLTATNTSGSAEAASPADQAAASELAASVPNTTPSSAKAEESAGNSTTADSTPPKLEPPIKLAALPDATTSSAEAGQQAGPQQSAKKPDAAELRAKRRARARRLALARERAAQLAQQQQATANSPFYGSNFSTTQNATSAVNSTPNVTPFGPPRGAP
jgi:hypothetical protein